MNTRVNQQKPSLQQSLPMAPELQMDAEALEQIYKENEKRKKISGFFLIFLLLLLAIGVNIINGIYIRSTEITKYSILGFFVFLFPILFTKFNLLQLIVDRWFPYLQEPDDFFRRVKF